MPTSTVGVCLSPATVAPVSPDGSSCSCPRGCGHSWKVGCGQSRPAPYSIPPGALPKTNGACTVCARKQPGCLLSSAGSMANPPRTCPSTDRERLAPPQHALSSESSSGQPFGAVFRRAPGIFSKGHCAHRAQLPLAPSFFFFTAHPTTVVSRQAASLMNYCAVFHHHSETAILSSMSLSLPEREREREREKFIDNHIDD